MSIVVRYTAFALIAGALNLGVQVLIISMLGTQALIVALLLGSAAGLLTKYVLDRRFVFRHELGVPIRPMREVSTFSRYTGTGVITTGIFWGCESTLYALTDDRALTLFGGAIGLIVGNWLKFHLDRRLTFVNRQDSEAPT